MSPQDIRLALSAFTPDWWHSRRWYAGKNRKLVGLDVFDHATLSEDPRIVLALVQLAYEEGPADLYALPLLFGPDGNTTDALEHSEYHRLLLTLLRQGVTRGPIRFESFAELTDAEPRLLRAEQSNTSIAYEHKWILKNIRRVATGLNRDLEIGQFLAQQTAFEHTPRVLGAITYHGKDAATLGVLQRFVENEGDGWSYFLSRLQPPPTPPDDVYWAQDGLPEQVNMPLMSEVHHLGRITGELHAALSSRPDIPDFAPEPVTDADRTAWLADASYQLAAASTHLSGTVEGFRERLRDFVSDLPIAGISKIQIHGDYHLGNVLKTPRGYTIIDFEGEPARPLEQRRAKQPALRDVAGMLRSLDYVANAVGLPKAGARAWSDAAGQRFVEGWREGSAAQGFASEARGQLMRFFQITKALYELNYELSNRPDWVHVPLRGIERLFGQALP